MEYGCWACKEKLPSLIAYLQANQKLFDIYLISFSPYDKEHTVLSFVDQVLHFKDKVFVLDETEYRTKNWSNFKLNRLLKELLPKDLCLQCNRKKIGYSDFILFDQQGKPIYNSTYDTDGVHRVQDLNAIIASAGL